MHVNNDFQKNSNISHIMETVWYSNKNNSNISRIDISKNLNLYRSTVGNVIQTLLDNKVIIEASPRTENEKMGRNPITLTINPDFGCIAGIELQPDVYNACICNFDGTILFSTSGVTPQFNSGTSEQDFNLILKAVLDNVLPQAFKLNIPLLSVCVGIPGIIDTDKGIIVSSEAFNLINFPYPVELLQNYPSTAPSLPLLFENDARCCSWYIKSQSRKEAEQDYLCVLTKNHNTRGISVGISISMNGKIISGKNHSAGEYISSSWRPEKNSQTGLAKAILTTVNVMEESYREWIKDLFSTITTFIPLLGPQTVYLFGQSDNKKDLINDVINKEALQFKVIMERCNSKLNIVHNNDYIIAEGAALMVIQKLFEIPSLKEPESISHLTWNQIFNIQQNQ